MRRICIAVALACAACSSGMGPSRPPDSIAGRWSSWGPGHATTPDGPEIITLTQSDTIVTGSDSWAARQSRVSGYYVRPAIQLTLFELTVHGIIIDTGQALDANRIRLNGTIFYRQ